MHLLTDQWIPVQRQSGKREFIAPTEITTQYASDPISFLDAPRPDFNGALMQFLIGLLQTAHAPEFRELRSSQWRKWYNTPPTKEELEILFAPILSAFNFDGDGARFMQDLELNNGEMKNIASMLLETPGENTIKDNSDHFIKRDAVTSMCKSCAAMALFDLQINAPSGGSGHRTSLRGGGPLTTLMVEKNSSYILPKLWRNLWLNILPTQEIVGIERNEKHNLHDIFPWIATTKTSETQRSITLADVHPMQLFWCMPRRIRLDFSATTDGYCDICGISTEHLLTKYITKNYGINYSSESFAHPFTPYYYENKNNLYFPTHLQPNGLGYKHWLHIALHHEGQRIAKVVEYCNTNDRITTDEQCSIWAFGYDTDNMKARCFYEAYLPFYHVNDAILENFVLTIESFIEAASLTLSYTKTALKQAWFQSPENAKGNVDINKEFWSDTESDFYMLLHRLKNGLEEAQDDEKKAIICDELRREWYCILRKEAFALFQRWSENAGVECENIRRLGLAYNDLCKKINGKKLRGILNLSQEIQPKK